MHFVGTSLIFSIANYGFVIFVISIQFSLCPSRKYKINYKR